MKKITILALHLGYGGIESCIRNVANLLCDKYNIEILSIYKLYDNEVEKLDDRVKVTYLTDLKPNRKEFKDNLKRIKLISAFKEGIKSLKILKIKKEVMINAIKNLDSDIIISTRIFLNNLLSEYGKGYLIGWEHNHHHGNKKYQEELLKSCRNLNKLVLVSESLKEDYEELFKENNSNCECVCIPNFIESSDNSKGDLDNNNLISVGRLSKEKGYSDLIDVFKLINDKNDNVHLNIIGDGDQKELLQNKINKLKLQDKITLHGYQNHEYINQMYNLSSIYLMTSFTESFGLVLIEAMNKGIVPIACDSAEGAKDIIKHNENGFLIYERNKEDMANQVLELLDNRDILKDLSKECIKTSKLYNADNNKKYWIKLLEEKK